MLLALLAFQTFEAGRRFVDPDELEHLNSAYFITRGETIYGSFFENHPPLTALLLQPVVRSSEEPALLIRRGRWLMLVLSAGILAVTGGLARRAGGWPASVLAALLLLSHVFFFQKTMEVRPDVPALLLLVLALAVMVRSGADARPRWPLAAGALLCMAGLFTPKVLYSALGATLAAAFVAGRRAPARRVRVALGTLALIVLGGVAVGALAAAEMARQGILEGFMADAIRLSLRMKVDDPSAFRWLYLKTSLGVNGAAWILAASGIAILWPRRRELPVGHVETLCLSLAAGLLGLFAIQAPMRQYFLTFLPQLAVLGASGALELGYWIAARQPRILASMALLSMVLLATIPPWVSHLEDRSSMEKQLAVIHKVLEVTHRDDRVFDCWTGLYLTRLPAYRYFYLNSDVQRLFRPEDLERGVLAALENPHVRLVIADANCGRLPGEVRRFVAQRFTPLPELPYLWLRR
jgi:hypothetical protein